MNPYVNYATKLASSARSKNMQEYWQLKQQNDVQKIVRLSSVPSIVILIVLKTELNNYFRCWFGRMQRLTIFYGEYFEKEEIY